MTRKRRKRRPGEVVCRCGAYRFPHRMMGGACDGRIFVARIFADQMWTGCRDCFFLEADDDGNRRCQVVDGREDALQCPVLDGTIRFEGIRLYGANKPPPKKGKLRFR